MSSFTMLSRHFNSSNVLLKHNLAILRFVSRSCSSSTTEPATYDLRYYKSPYNENQSQILLSVLNTFSQNELVAYKIPKLIASKICVRRMRRGKMCDLKELSLVADIGVKRIETLCNKILKYQEDTSEEVAVKKKSVNSFIKSIKPKLTHANVQNEDNIVSVILRGKTLAWCNIIRLQNDTENSQKPTTAEDLIDENHSPVHYILGDIGYSILADVSDNKELCDQLMTSISKIPQSRMYVLTSKEANSDDMINASLQCHRTGILVAALTDQNAGSTEVEEAPFNNNDLTTDPKGKGSPNIYFIRESSAVKSLYNMVPTLKINPVISSLTNKLIPNLLTPEDVIDKYRTSCSAYQSKALDRALMMAYYLVMP